MKGPHPDEQHPEIAKLKRGDVILFRGRARVVIDTYRGNICVVRLSYPRTSSRSCVKAHIYPTIAERESGITVVATDAVVPGCRVASHVKDGYCE